MPIHDPQVCKLGKREARHVKGMKMLSALTAALPAPPPAVGWYKGCPIGTNPVTDFPMDGNDTVGDCTIAGVSHALQLWTTLNGSPVVPTDAEVISEYSRLTGYNPVDPSTDQGAVETDILTAWQSGGIFGHKIDGYVGVNVKSQVQFKDAIHYFGSAYLGVELPITAQDQTIWDVVPGNSPDAQPDSWGGHCVVAVAADERYIVVVTWGSLKLATWEWMFTYCSEAYAIMSPDWVAKGQTPGGVPLASLREDFIRLTA
jgi:hypothetical protein